MGSSHDVDDILLDLYGSQHVEGSEFDFVKCQAPMDLDTATEPKELAYYPLEKGSSYSYSCLNILDLAKTLTVGGSDYFSLDRTLYHRMCIRDQLKLFKSTAHLTHGESFALKSSSYGPGNPPLYLKYYNKEHTIDLDNNDRSSLLSTSIDELFKKIIDEKIERGDKSDRTTKLAIRKRNKANPLNVNKNTEKYENWCSKYAPKYFSELLTNENVNLECLRWLSSWNSSSTYIDKYELDRRILLLGGPPGVGKTILVRVIAAHCGYNIVEINASDDRSKSRIVPIINGVISANSVNPSKPNLCLLEDIDNLVHTETHIITFLKNISNKRTSKGNHVIRRPIICTCNDVYERKLRDLRDVSKVVTVDTCDPMILQQRLEYILESEGFVASTEFLQEIQTTYNNDIRSCISALEFLSSYDGDLDGLNQLDLSKDNNEGVDRLLKLVYTTSDDPTTLNKIETQLSVTINNLGYNSTIALLSENTCMLPTKRYDHFWKLSIFLDILAQGDCLSNRVGTAIQLLNVACGFVNKFICNTNYGFYKRLYPSKLVYNKYFNKQSQSKNAIHALKKSTLPIIAQGILTASFAYEIMPYILEYIIAANATIGSLSTSFILRILKGLDPIWECLCPLGSVKLPSSLLQLMRAISLIAILGINITEVRVSYQDIRPQWRLASKGDSEHCIAVNQVISYDPPILSLYIMDKKGQGSIEIPQKSAGVIRDIVEYLKSGNRMELLTKDDVHFQGSTKFNDSPVFTNINDAVKYIYANGISKFNNLYQLDTKAAEPVKYTDYMIPCINTHKDIPSITFSHVTYRDLLSFQKYQIAILNNRVNNIKRAKPIIKTCGTYKYQDQNCSAVRCIINQLD